ncbi:MAG: hypothetical protein Kow0098_00900 [Ignavibacteriaceae bacterium]
MYIAGGVEFDLPACTITSTSLTPHTVKWTGSRSKEEFIVRFKAYSKYEA